MTVALLPRLDTQTMSVKLKSEYCVDVYVNGMILELG